MSSKCPECGQSIEQEFGVATCPQCGSVLFIDMNGQVQLNKNEAFIPEEISPTEELVPLQSEQSFEDQWMQDQSPTPQIPDGPPSLIPSYNEVPNYSEPIEIESEPMEISSEPEPLHIQDLSSVEHELPELPLDEVQSERLFEPIVEFGQSEENFTVENSGLTDVSKFANSDQSFGPLSYSVIIENIDTKEIRAQLQEALVDPKFQWDSKALLREIKMGKLKLENLNPVKVSILVERLQDVPVKVSWTQHAYS
jgi:DNA-directed RNA polymerase subunit RPC12/RpoP